MNQKRFFHKYPPDRKRAASPPRRGGRAPGPGRQLAPGPAGRSQVVVEGELVGVGAQAQRLDLVGALVVDPGLNEVGGEDVALGEVVVVRLQGVQGLVQAVGELVDVEVLLGRQLVEVLVNGLAGLNTSADAVDPGHEDGGEAQVGVRRGVGHAVLHPLGLGRGAGHGDADAGRAVAGGVDQVDRGLEAGDQAVEGVHRGVGEGQEAGGVGQDAADVPAGQVGELAVAALVEEQGPAVLPQGVVAVHARAVVPEDRLGHEGRRLALPPGLVLDHVLELHHVVARGEQGVEAVVDLLLPGGAHLVVGALDLQADRLAGGDHGVTDVGHLVVGGDREVAALEGGLVALVAALLLAPGVPGCLGGVHGVGGSGGRGVVAHGVEQVELGLGADVAGVGDAGGAQVGLGLGGDGAGVAGVDLVGEGVHDREVDHQGPVGAEGVQEGGGHVGDELHVGLVDGLEAPDRGAVEHEAVGQGVVLEGRHRDGEVLHHPGQVTEADVNEVDVLLLDVGQGLRSVLEHTGSFLTRQGSAHRGWKTA